MPSLVQSLYEERWSGLLTVTNAGVGKSVTVHEGRMVFASSSSVDDRLGELLLCRGKLTLQHFVDGSKAIAPGKRLGTILVEMGALSPKDLVRAVIEQTQEIIYGLFLWTEGRYQLQEGPPPPESIKLNLSTPDLIMEGIRRIQSWSRIEHAVGGPATRFRRAEGYASAIANMTLGPEARAIVDGLDAPRSVSEMCEGSALPDVEVCRLIWAFRVLGVLLHVDAVRRARLMPGADDEGLGWVLGPEE